MSQLFLALATLFAGASLAQAQECTPVQLNNGCTTEWERTFPPSAVCYCAGFGNVGTTRAMADVGDCAGATQSLSNIIQGYTDTARECQGQATGTQLYAQLQQSERDYETLYQRAQALCEQACSFDAFSQSLCARIPSLSGGCP